MVIGLAAIGTLLAIPAYSVARGSKVSPAQSVAAMALVHNSFATGLADEFVGQPSLYAGEVERCHEAEESGSENGEQHLGEIRVREDAAHNRELVEKNLMPFNRDVARWAKEAEGFKTGSRPARKRLKVAIADLRSAHTAHEKEFFDLKGIWVDMEALNCSGAEQSEREATEVGTHAWVKEFKGLSGLAQLFGVKKTPVEFSFGPYVPYG